MAPMAAHAEPIRYAIATVTGFSVVGAWGWVSKNGGSQGLRVWLAAIEEAKRTSAERLVRRGLELPNRGESEAESCVTDLIAGLDEWRRTSVRHESRLRNLRWGKKLLMAMVVACVGIWSSHFLSGAYEGIQFAFAIAWAVCFGGVLVCGAPLAMLVWDVGGPRKAEPETAKPGSDTSVPGPIGKDEAATVNEVPRRAAQ